MTKEFTEVLKLHKQGLSTRQIGAKLGFSKSKAHHILKKIEEEKRQEEEMSEYQPSQEEVEGAKKRIEIFSEICNEARRIANIDITKGEQNEITIIAISEAVKSYNDSIISLTTESIKNKMLEEIEKEREKLVTDKDYYEYRKNELARREQLFPKDNHLF
ncbi:hypothetical protein [Bernardetia sp.]|uniref:hypothetical protein n=1 Tax=Bernardetia sp. TaxID=1937974 RepID=UPI0025BDFEAC|nr:hypothetical protein [Bernardetia sp.]